MKKITEITTTVFILLSAVSIVIIASSGALIYYLNLLLNIDHRFLFEARLMFGLLLLSYFIRLPFTPFAMGMYIQQKFVLVNVIGFFMQLIQMAILFTLLFCVSTSVIWLVVATVVTENASFIIRCILSKRYIPSLKLSFSSTRWDSIKDVLSFGIWRFLISIAYDIRRGADAIILNKLATPLDVTTFYLGSTIFNQIESTSIMVTEPLQPTLIAMDSTGEKDKLKKMYIRGGKYGLWIALSVSIPLIIFSKEFIKLYVGDKFIVSSTVMTLLLLQFPASYGHIMFTKISYAMAKIRMLSIASLTIQVVNLLLTIYLVGFLHMGAVGSALGTLIMTLTGYTVIFWTNGISTYEYPFQ